MATTPKLDLRQIRLRDLYLADYPNTIYGLGEWRRYYDGVWNPLPELVVKHEMQKCISEQRRIAVKVDNGLINSVASMLKAHTITRDELFDADESLLIFDDCTLNYLTDERRGHMLENYRTTKLPFRYDADAKSDCWANFLSSTVSEEAAEFLQEFAGYAITTSTRYETAI